MTAKPSSASLNDLTWESFKIGCLGFGGPTGQISLLHRVFVDDRKWVEEDGFQRALNFCMLLPGPEAQQLAVYLGWIHRGVVGGLIAGALFVVPGMIFMLAISWAYASSGQFPVTDALFAGIKAAVIAIVIDALLRIGRRALGHAAQVIIAITSFLALTLLGIPYPLVIIAAAVFAMLALPRENADKNQTSSINAGGAVANNWAATFRTAGVWLAIWLLPLLAIVTIWGGENLIAQIGLLFSQLSLVTFGGAYSVLAYLQQVAVNVHGWLPAGEMIDGLGLAETTPGPLVLVNQFVGFMAGWHEGGLFLAIAAALVASWCTFIPSFLWIFVGAPFAEKLQRNAIIANGLKGVTTAVLGVIVSLAFWFSTQVLFTDIAAIELPWHHQILLPDLMSFDALNFALSAAAALAIIRARVNILIVISACALVSTTVYYAALLLDGTN